MPYLTLSWSNIVPSSSNDMNSGLLTDLFKKGCFSIETCGGILHYGTTTVFSEQVDALQDCLLRLLVIKDDVAVVAVPGIDKSSSNKVGKDLDIGVFGVM